MEYVLLALLIVIIIMVGVLLLRKKENTDIAFKVSELNTSMIKELGEFKSGFNKEQGEFKSVLTRELKEDFISLNERIEYRLNLINDKVNERLDQNFEKTNKTFTNVLERLSKIDEAQKKIDSLSTDIISLQSILTDKKTRGTFGEVNLYHIMNNIFGDNEKMYKMQYDLPNGTTVDCILFGPESLGLIGIDSKFPLENYRIMVDRNETKEARSLATKKFESDMKKHIDDISKKYIIPGVTANQAILFLPAEAIFAEVVAYHSSIIDYAYEKRVMITSPTTLISTLTTLQLMMKDLERTKYANVIQNELKLLSEEFRRYKERWDKLARNIDTVSTEVKQLHTTSDKITKRFNVINQVEMESLDEETE